MTLLPTMSRPGCTVRVMCSVTVEVRAVLTEELLRVAVQKYCPARNLAIALSVRKLDTSPTSGGGGWGRSYTTGSQEVCGRAILFLA